MRPRNLERNINLLKAEGETLQRELKNSIIGEYLTVKGRIRTGVEVRLKNCKMELEQLINQKKLEDDSHRST